MKSGKKNFLLLLFGAVLMVNMVWAICIYHTAISNWFNYSLLGKLRPPIITTQKGLFPLMLFEDGEYHYIYWVEDDEVNYSDLPNYFTKDGREYIDLGVANSRLLKSEKSIY